MTKRERRIRAAARAWLRRTATLAQRDLLLKIGVLAPIVKPLRRKR
jgi:hypothetical protein